MLFRSKLWGVPAYVISAVFVAFGTSFPELVTALIACIKGKNTDLITGNIIGSNIFNILGVLAMPALLSPSKLASSVIYRDYPIMMLFTVVVWLLSALPPNKNQFSRGSGLILFIGFLVYMAVVIWFQ